MLPAEQSLKEMARDAMDIVNCKKIIRDAIDNPVLEMARQMRREEEERMQAFAKFADAGITESARMRAIASEAESAFRRSGAEEACASITEQQKLMQLALPDPQLADYLTAALPQSLVDQQTMRMAKMAESLAADLTATAREYAAMANPCADLAARLSESHWLQSLRNDYVSIVESYAANPAFAQWREIERSVQHSRPSTKTRPEARPPRRRDEDQTASATAPGQGGNQHQTTPESPNTANHAALRRVVIDRSCPSVQHRQCFTLIGLVESEIRLFIANKLEPLQLDVGGICAIFDEKIIPKDKPRFAERLCKEQKPQSVFAALGFGHLRELGRLINNDQFSVLFDLCTSDLKLLGKTLNKLNDRRNPVNHYRPSGNPDQILQDVKDLASEVFRLIGLPTDVDAFLHEVDDTSGSRTLH